MVSAGNPSRTAILSAVGRGLHREGSPPHVFDDTLAFELAGSEGSALADRLRAELPSEQLDRFARWTAARARFVEDAVERAVEAGVRQYAILGAGLDSFAYRHSELLGRLGVFEVDHPGSQEWKRQRLDELRIEAPSALAFVPVDFERETLADALARGGLDAAQPTIFAWIGVTMYLSLEAVEATLRTVASYATGTRLVLSYELPAGALSGGQLSVLESLMKIVSQLGEPFVTMFEPPEIEALLRRAGFVDIQHFGPADAARVYFREDVAVGGSQRLATATVA